MRWPGVDDPGHDVAETASSAGNAGVAWTEFWDDISNYPPLEIHGENEALNCLKHFKTSSQE